jgi:hypothetical protein
VIEHKTNQFGKTAVVICSLRKTDDERRRKENTIKNIKYFLSF